MSTDQVAKCSLCGEAMPAGETMFKFHGYSCPCPKPPLKAHQRRVVDEKEELVKKATALNHFIGREVFDTIDPAEQERLKEQHDIMWKYVEVLTARIAAFK